MEIKDVNIFYEKPVYLESELDFSKAFNPITLELIIPERWEDGLYIFPDLFKNTPNDTIMNELKFTLVFEIENHKIIKVYKNTNPWN